MSTVPKARLLRGFTLGPLDGAAGPLDGVAGRFGDCPIAPEVFPGLSVTLGVFAGAASDSDGAAMVLPSRTDTAAGEDGLAAEVEASVGSEATL